MVLREHRLGQVPKGSERISYKKVTCKLNFKQVVGLSWTDKGEGGHPWQRE